MAGPRDVAAKPEATCTGRGHRVQAGSVRTRRLARAVNHPSAQSLHSVDAPRPSVTQ